MSQESAGRQGRAGLKHRVVLVNSAVLVSLPGNSR